MKRVSLDEATGLDDSPPKCLKRIKAFFESGALCAENEPDLAELDRAFALLLANPPDGLNAMKALAERGALMAGLYVAEA
ncbi:MAG TPA: hypothetical protein VE397_01650, partial [Stellaceae bacterium]|nr:hypothetical protein [Stellaceae bacterium]